MAMGNTSGIALIAVLWVTALLAAIAASLMSTTRTELILARNAAETAKAEALADAGIYHAIPGLLDSERTSAPRNHGGSSVFALGEGAVRVAIEEEVGKVDLNYAIDELLVGLILALGVEQTRAVEIAAAIVEARTASPFATVEQLRDVAGMTSDLYRRMTPYVTVYSWQRGINPYVALPVVLLALPGIDPEDIRSFLTVRSVSESALAGALPLGGSAAGQQVGSGGTIARAVAFARQESLNKRLQVMRSTNGVRRSPVTRSAPGAELARFLSSEPSTIFTVRAEARISSGARFVRQAVVAVRPADDRQSTYAIYRWSRGAAGDLIVIDMAREDR